jgi:hypothetical protein
MAMNKGLAHFSSGVKHPDSVIFFSPEPEMIKIAEKTIRGITGRIANMPVN